MAVPHNRSLCIALGRMRFVIVTACWLIAMSLVVQLIIWSLCTFTELRYAGAGPAEATPLVVKGDEKKKDTPSSKKDNKPESRWRPGGDEGEEEPPPPGTVDRIFKVVSTVARTTGLMSALVICPLLSLGVILAVPAGAPRVERSVNALTWAIVLVLLAMPLGGWFGMAWQQGTITDYRQMVMEVEAARIDGLTPVFYARFLLLPAASAVGFILVGIHFSSSVAAVLLRRDLLDPELEREASGVAATSLHGTGRTAGALTKALEQSKSKAQRSTSMSKIQQGEIPRRLI